MHKSAQRSFIFNSHNGQRTHTTLYIIYDAQCTILVAPAPVTIGHQINLCAEENELGTHTGYCL